MKLSGKVGYDTRNKLEHFGDDSFNPLDTGFIFLFSEYMSAPNITEQRMD